MVAQIESNDEGATFTRNKKEFDTVSLLSDPNNHYSLLLSTEVRPTILDFSPDQDAVIHSMVLAAQGALTERMESESWNRLENQIWRETRKKLASDLPILQCTFCEDKIQSLPAYLHHQMVYHQEAWIEQFS